MTITIENIKNFFIKLSIIIPIFTIISEKLINKKGCIVADDDGATSKEFVYAGGDVVTGVATVILAMGAGKKAAAAIHEALKNK